MPTIIHNRGELGELSGIKFHKEAWPAVDADGDVIMGLIGAHLMQHFQNGRDGVWYTVIWPVDIVQLFQSSATLEKIQAL